MLKVATFNCNSVRSRLPLIVDWLKRESPDVLCLQETKVQDEEFPALEFQTVGYHVVFRGQKAHAGVALATRSKPKNVRYGLDDGGPADEPRLVQATVEGIPIVNTYVPQGQSLDSPMFQYKLEWFARLRTYFDRYFAPDKPLLWCGDFNVAPEEIDVHSPEKLKDHVDFHPQARAALDQVRRWGFVDVFRLFHPGEPGHYTFWDYRVPQAVERNVGWRVDHIWTTKPLAARALRCWIDREARRTAKPSDHTFLVAEFSP